eukprot:12115_1
MFDIIRISTIVNIILCITTLIVFVKYVYQQLRKNKSFTICESISIMCECDYGTKEIISGAVGIFCYMLSPLVGFFGMTDFFGAYNVSIDTCKAVYIAVLCLYKLGNVSLFFLFSYQIESLFNELQDTQLKTLFCNLCKYRKCTCLFYRFIGFVCIIGVWVVILYIHYDDIEIREHNFATSCYPQGLDIWWYMYRITEVVFTLFTAVIYTQTLCQLSQGVANVDQNNQTDLNTRLASVTKKVSNNINKHVAYTLIAALGSTVIFQVAVIGHRDLGYFASIDGAINSFCIYFMFNGCCQTTTPADQQKHTELQDTNIKATSPLLHA